MPFRPGGFTLVELLLVMVLLALMAGVAAPRVMVWLDGARQRGALAELAAWLEAQPAAAFFAGEVRTLGADDAPPLPPDWHLDMDPPPRYEANGMAAGGRVQVWAGADLLADWRILSPTGGLDKHPGE